MILNETYTLENGLSIPKLGLGTWFIDDDQAAMVKYYEEKMGVTVGSAPDDAETL